MHRQQGLFQSVYVDDTKMTGREHNLEPMWNRWMKHDVLEKPTIFLIKCIGDALNVNVSQTQRLSTSARSFSNLASPQVQSRAYLAGRNRTRVLPPGLHYMEAHAKKCGERYCEGAEKNNER